MGLRLRVALSGPTCFSPVRLNETINSSRLFDVNFAAPRESVQEHLGRATADQRDDEKLPSDREPMQDLAGDSERDY